MTDPVQLKITADMSDYVAALRKFGEACRQVQKVLADSLRPAFKDFLEILTREWRTGAGPWYCRWYWRAAYAIADQFPEWVSPD